ncbi:Protein DedA [uncultured bacterium]|nr:Protein DedA [uncultured bacterium]
MEIIEFLLHLLKDPLATLQNFLAQYQALTYALVALIVFVETGLIVMPILPGDSLLFAIGLLASSTGQLDITLIIPLLIGSALLGDNVNYFVGKNFSRLIRKRERILFFKHEYLVQTEAFYQKHGGKAVIAARFVPIVRTVAPFVAGAGSMKYSKYLLFCVLGATLWVTSLSLAGYFLGTNEWVKVHFEKIVLGIVFVSFLPMILHVMKEKFSKKA